MLFACRDYDDYEPVQEKTDYVNPPYPLSTDSLRILAIGNSFTDDATFYLPALIDYAGIDKKLLCVYTACLGSANFTTWLEKIESSDSVEVNKAGGAAVMNKRGTIRNVLAQNWDIIVIQQSSDLSYKWSSYVPLADYINAIDSFCTNKNVCLAFQLVWSHIPDEMPYVLDKNISCCRNMQNTYGIDVIVPTGTAIQLARNTSLSDASYLTRDKWHLNLGIGRYIASCTWFERLIAPHFGITVLGNNARPKGTYSDANITLAQKCAIQAIKSPFEYTDIIVK